ncbi:MAG: hypothetical protein KBA66_21750 [Leptospiraceae bacterium]|nr:hypothetical protein [Leptospiraceae bacterium]
MELRFPLDMGILIITCPNCKTSFRMDPDDPKTYHSGTFDLSHSEKKTLFPHFLTRPIKGYLSSKKDIQFIIPIFLFLILILNLIKIFTTVDTFQKNGTGEEKQEFLKELEPDKQLPEDNPNYPEPSVEI